MRVCQCVEFGAPLVISEALESEAGPGEVKVRVMAVGVAYADAITTMGLYQVKPPLPYVIGNEFAGVIESVGEGVKHLNVGDRIMGVGNGVLAETAVVAAMSCVKLPENISDNAAGGFIISYCTALYALDTIGALKAGETVLVLGAAGAVGMAAIKVAKALGANVIAAASTAEKRQACLANGADATVDYSQANWRDELKTLNNGQGIHVVFDLVGGNMSETALRSLVPQGRFLVVGFASGKIPSIPLNLPLLKRCSILGADFGGHLRQQADIIEPLLQKLMGWLVAEVIVLTEPEAVFPLAQTQAALDKIMARNTVGKVIIRLDD
jgi:NADPH2:quinone reductase